MAAEAEGEGFRLGRIKTSRLHTLQYTGYPKKKLLTEKAKKAEKAKSFAQFLKVPKMDQNDKNSQDCSRWPTTLTSQ